jgi:hypothetical protein
LAELAPIEIHGRDAMSNIKLKMGLLAGAALALTIAGVGVAQTIAPKAMQVAEERQGEMTPDMAAPDDMDGGPNGEHRVMAMRRHHGMGGMGPMGEHRMDPAAHAKRLSELLQLRPDQQPALQAFVASMRPPEGGPADHGDGERGKNHEKLAAMTTPERLDWMAARMNEHMARFQKHAEAVKRFYAALSPDQRKAFEAAHIGERGMMGGARRMHMAMLPSLSPLPPTGPTASEPPAPGL